MSCTHSNTKLEVVPMQTFSAGSAIQLLLRPPLDPASHTCLSNLKDHGLDVFGYFILDAETFEEYIRPSLENLSLTIINPLPANPSGLFGPCVTQIQQVAALSRAVPPEQVLVVSSSSMSASEPATAMRMATALLVRPDVTQRSTLCPRPPQDKWTRSAAADKNEMVQNPRVCDMYQLDRVIAGDRAVNWLTNDRAVVKAVISSTSKGIVPYEAKVYRQLAGSPVIPFIHWSGTYGETDVIVMECLGPTLANLRLACRGTLTLKSLLMIGI
ncbi:uncharacterized protein BT62DRAFT_1001774 [Guyanagaster necrorhizus]|uniref:Uncharacterized protein n=1 Tax=Guyanagaster necrorhizus TaxID=856835 RepID=A0A9P7W201_9AGAR|nr:uncharacterized protein BT62DRAFT_1001774 [Guyanagaster necrorhizus MCA 3950]KAG7450925.1 hypothetical protein BT62DRAFT_1001774 [Guyanagaster necrorhizus MCA 3950]